MLSTITKAFNSNERKIKKYLKIVDKIEAMEEQISALSDEELAQSTEKFKAQYAEGKTLSEILPEAFAVVREVSKRTIGLRHFRVQLLGGMFLHDGDISEMKTGEGKTLVQTLPAYLNALTGESVHIITANDYLAKRDYEWMKPIFDFLGLSVGLNLPNMSTEEKRTAYLADITHGTNNEFGFDYLRDNMVLDADNMVQRPLNFAIVDEVDSILIDEARTPLIISGPAQSSTETYYVADQVVKALIEEDYTIDWKTKQVSLSEIGIKKVEQALHIDNLYELKYLDLNHHIQQSLKAHTIMRRDQDYVVSDKGVVIVDEFTGRLMEGRRYSDGLHQSIEAKEGLQVRSESMTLATITLQNYFRLYKKIAGMTGTAKTEEEELRKIYNMRVIQVPTNKQVVRKDLYDLFYSTEQAKYRAVVKDIVKRHKSGQPLLVGTVSIENSERLSKLLEHENVPHQVLNAKNHEREAEIIAAAGQKNSVTIATNMAGRGTDIVLGEGVSELGGLHVIGTERHESRRIDNQLRGRSGRQGDPGSSQFFLSGSDELMRRFVAGEKMAASMKRAGYSEDQPLNERIFSRIFENAQKMVEGNNFDARRAVLQYDDVMNQQRKVIYNQRREVLIAEDLEPTVTKMVEGVVTRLIEVHAETEALTSESDLHSIIEFINANLLPENRIKEADLESLDVAGRIAKICAEVKSLYHERVAEVGQEYFQLFARGVILHAVDRKWMDHIDAMEHLRQGIHLRSYGQEEPIRAYQLEGFKMFEEMVQEIQLEALRYVFKAEYMED